MKTALVAAAIALSLGGCASSYHQQSEKAETVAETLYVLTVHALDSQLQQGTISQATHDDIWRKSWTALQDVRTQYNLGLAINLAVLQATAQQAGVSSQQIQTVGK